MWVSLITETSWAHHQALPSVGVRGCVCGRRVTNSPAEGVGEGPRPGNPILPAESGRGCCKTGQGWALLPVSPQGSVDLWTPHGAFIHPFSHSQCFWAPPVSQDLCKALGGVSPGVYPPLTPVSHQHRNDGKTKR